MTLDEAKHIRRGDRIVISYRGMGTALHGRATKVRVTRRDGRPTVLVTVKLERRRWRPGDTSWPRSMTVPHTKLRYNLSRETRTR